MKRFYKTVGTLDGAVLLDGKPVKTPLGNALRVGPDLAAAIAEEWKAQGREILPASMPLMQLACTMIDKGEGPDRAAMDEQVLGYAATDLVCYHADHPQKLVRLHEEAWHPLLAWLKEEHGVALETVSGIRHHAQNPAALDKLREIVTGLNAKDFTVVQAVTAATGSLVIALALLAGRIAAEAAWRAACVDELYQLETWGEDVLARQRLDHLRAELTAVARFHAL